MNEKQREIIKLLNAFAYKKDIRDVFNEARRRIEFGTLHVFSGVLETNDGKTVGEAGRSLSDYSILSGINWYYRNITER